MNELYCNVKDCHHNRGDVCAKDLIMVDYSFKDETKCRSFQARQKASFTAEMGKEFQIEGRGKTQVNCRVDNCTYNRDYECYAKSVDIVEQAKGDSRCDTFKE